MTEHLPRRNLLRFNKEYFIQTSGTDIGTKLTPGCANLIFGRDMLHQYLIYPFIWPRYIDDIFIIWNESEDKLEDILTYITTVNPSILFTHAYSFKSANFQDVFVTLTDDRTISADQCSTPTDTH